MRNRLSIFSFKCTDKRMNSLKKILSVAVGCIIFCVCLCKVTGILERKDSYSEYAAFFQQEEDFDVLFFGSSHIYYGIYPTELWEKYGIVSYNMADNSSNLANDYWKMMNSFDYTNPKLVVVDIWNSQTWFNQKISNISITHSVLDCFPLSITKVNAVWDLFDRSNSADVSDSSDIDDALELLFTLGLYHTRWTALNQADFDDIIPRVTKGSGVMREVVIRQYEDNPNYMQDELIFDEIGYNYLRKMIESCQKRGVDILFINTGYDANRQSRYFSSFVPLLAEEYSVRYLDLTEHEDIINNYTDFNDLAIDDINDYANAHLNVSGARKVTEFLGNYITENYNIPDKRNDVKYSHWYSDCKEYADYYVRLIEGEQDIYSYLTLLANDNFSFCIYIKKNSLIMQDSQFINLVKNIAKYENFVDMNQLMVSEGRYCITTEGSESEFWENVGLDEPVYTADGNAEEPEIQIYVVNKYTNEVISASKWYYILKDIMLERR